MGEYSALCFDCSSCFESLKYVPWRLSFTPTNVVWRNCRNLGTHYLYLPVGSSFHSSSKTPHSVAFRAVCQCHWTALAQTIFPSCIPCSHCHRIHPHPLFGLRSTINLILS